MKTGFETGFQSKVLEKFRASGANQFQIIENWFWNWLILQSTRKCSRREMTTEHPGTFRPLRGRLFITLKINTFNYWPLPMWAYWSWQLMWYRYQRQDFFPFQKDRRVSSKPFSILPLFFLEECQKVDLFGEHRPKAKKLLMNAKYHNKEEKCGGDRQLFHQRYCKMWRKKKLFLCAPWPSSLNVDKFNNRVKIHLIKGGESLSFRETEEKPLACFY